MKNTNKILLLLILIPLFLVSCQENDTIDAYFYEGVNYNKLNGLNAESTWMYDVRDNEVYPIVELGGKYWMGENLRYDVESTQLNPNNPSKEYGRLYDWNTAKTACPKGWHLSSDSDWKALEEAMGMDPSDLSVLGARTLLKLSGLKSQTGWKNGDNGSNTASFSIFPSGRYESNAFQNLGDHAFFWTSTLNSTTEAISRYLFHRSDQINRAHINKTIHQSCRCVLN